MRIDIGLPSAPEPVTRKSRAIVGIDLGTTNSCAAVVKDGRPYVIPSREGYNTVPSVVALNSRNRIVVGHLAKAQLLTNPRATVYGAKRLVGRSFESDVVQEIRSKFAYEIVPDANGLASVRLGPETLSLEQISALILREVKEVAQNHLQEEVNRAVITVPAYYNERQRAAVRHAGALAGLHVERILNEPTAAALAYAFGRNLNQRVLVYDLGGGTFDASVLELADNVYEVVSTGGDTFLGGVDFDNRIVDRLLAAWKERTGSDVRRGPRRALAPRRRRRAREVRPLRARTTSRSTSPSSPSRTGSRSRSRPSLSRDDVVALVEPLVDRTIEVCREVLAAKELQPADIDEVLLVGGQSRMPLVHEKVAAFFGRPPSRAVHPDEAVAVGAALLAYSLGSAEGVVLIDVLPMSIGIGLPGGRVKGIIERNTPLPTRKQYGLATTRDGQTEFELVVYQGESGRAAECEYLGTVRLTGLPPGPRGHGEDRGELRARPGVPPHRDREGAEQRPAGAGGDVGARGAEGGAPEARAGGGRPGREERLVPGASGERRPGAASGGAAAGGRGPRPRRVGRRDRRLLPEALRPRRGAVALVPVGIRARRRPRTRAGTGASAARAPRPPPRPRAGCSG